jgi:DNA-binding NarL/FixJ family response regulator
MAVGRVREKWVRRQRIVNGRNPDTGSPTRVGPRAAQVIALHKQGIKQSVIADEMGISPGRVSQILNGTG